MGYQLITYLHEASDNSRATLVSRHASHVAGRLNVGATGVVCHSLAHQEQRGCRGTRDRLVFQEYNTSLMSVDYCEMKPSLYKKKMTLNCVISLIYLNKSTGNIDFYNVVPSVNLKYLLKITGVGLDVGSHHRSDEYWHTQRDTEVGNTY